MRCVIVILVMLCGATQAGRMTMRLHNGTVVPLWTHENDIGTRMQCDHSSYSVVTCIRDFVDTNRDDGVTAEEIDAAKSEYMHWWERTLSFIVSRGSSSDIVERCDVNTNGKIDIDDLQEWNHRCEQYKTPEDLDGVEGLCLCDCKSIDSISKYLCDRARQ